MKNEKLKILFIVNDLTYFRLHRENIALALVRMGHEVIVAAGQCENVDISSWPASMRVEPLYLNRHRFDPFGDTKLVWVLSRLLSTEKPDLVHTITIKPNLLGAIAALVSRSRPRSFVWTFPGLGKVFEPGQSRYGRFRQKMVAWILSGLSKRLKITATFENEQDLDYVTGLGILSPTNSHTIMGTGLPRQLIDTKAGSKPRGDKLIVLMASRLLKSKGVDAYLEAAASLRHERLEFRLAGPIDEKNPDCMPRSVINTAVSRGEISYLGSLGSTDVIKAMASADVFCLPTRLREGFPRSLMEAAAQGCCLVAPAQRVIRKLLIPGKTGYVLPTADAKGLRTILSRLSKEIDFAREMGLFARTQVTHMPLWDENVVADFMKVYALSLGLEEAAFE